MTMLVMTLEKLLQLLFVLFVFWLEIPGTLNKDLCGHNAPENMHVAAVWVSLIKSLDDHILRARSWLWLSQEARLALLPYFAAICC